MIEKPTTLKACLLDPIPEIFEAAGYLNDAVSAHLEGNRAMADELIRMADMPAIHEWFEALWGKGGPHSRPLPVEDPVPHFSPGERVEKRQAGGPTKRALVARDGYHCRFCGIPLVRGSTRNFIRSLYPDALRWDKSNPGNHAAFQTMNGVIE